MLGLFFALKQGRGFGTSRYNKLYNRFGYDKINILNIQ